MLYTSSAFTNASREVNRLRRLLNCLIIANLTVALLQLVLDFTLSGLGEREELDDVP